MQVKMKLKRENETVDRPAWRCPDPLLLFCVSLCTITLACASPTQEVYPGTLSRVGLLPVEVTRTITLYEAGFGEGFGRFSLDPVEMGTSNTAGDIILMAIWLLSIPVGVVGGIVEERRAPSPEERDRIRAIVEPVLPEFDLGKVVRGKIAAELRGLVDATARELIDRRRYPVDRVLEVGSLEEARDEDLTMLFEVRIEQIVVNSPWDENPQGQIVLDTVARLLDPRTGEEQVRRSLHNTLAGDPLDWSLLEAGEVERFAERLTEAFQYAGRSLGGEIVREFWGWNRDESVR